MCKHAEYTYSGTPLDNIEADNKDIAKTVT